MNFSQLTPNAERLLQEILDHRLENGNCDINYWSRRFTGLSFADDSLLRSQFKVLSDYELIRTSWANNRPYIILITEYGYSYSEAHNRLVLTIGKEILSFTIFIVLKSNVKCSLKILIPTHTRHMNSC